jgi:hypothetical protein
LWLHKKSIEVSAVAHERERSRFSMGIPDGFEAV